MCMHACMPHTYAAFSVLIREITEMMNLAVPTCYCKFIL